MPASSAAMSESQQKYERETIGRWYWGYVRISQKHPRCEGRYFRRTDTNVQRPRTVLNPASMHSIVYVSQLGRVWRGPIVPKWLCGFCCHRRG